MVKLGWIAWFCGMGMAWATPTKPPAPKAEIIDFEHEWDRTGVIGVPYVLHGRLIAATDLKSVRPIANATVELVLFKDEIEHRTTARTGADGRVWLRVDTTALTPGTWGKIIHYQHGNGGGGLGGSEGIEFRSATLMRLGTDRPIYEPDQTVRWRLMAVHRATVRPREGKASVVITDPRGTQIWRGVAAMDDRGMAVGSLPLGPDARRGRWRITAQLGEESISTTFDFKRVELAPFQVRATPVADTPGRVKVTATYPYGEPVEGTLLVQHGLFKGKPMPLTDGKAMLNLGVGGGSVQLTVRDGAKREARTVVPAKMSAPRTAQVAVLPEMQVKGRTGYATILTIDAEGELAPGTVEVRVGDGPWRPHQTQGALRLPIRPAAGQNTLHARFEGRDAMAYLETREKNVPRVHAVRAIVDVGQPIEVRGRWPRARGQLVATVFQSQAPVAQVPLQRDRQGRVRGRFKVPAVQGLLQVRITDTGWWLEPDASPPQDHGLLVYVRPKQLDVRITTDTPRVRPGETARLAVHTHTRKGLAAVGVGLAVSVVDTRLLALGPLPSALLQSLHTLDVEQAHRVGMAFSELVMRPEKTARIASRGLLTLLPDEMPESVRVVPGEARWHAEYQRFEGTATGMVSRAAAWPGRLARQVNGTWRFVAPLHRLLEGPLQRDAWDRPVRWQYVEALGLDFSFATHVSNILDLRLELLRDAAMADSELYLDLRGGRPFQRRLPDHLLRDPWGRLFVWRIKPGQVDVLSRGPDGREGTDDDIIRTQFFSRGAYGYGSARLGARRSRRVSVVPGRAMVRGAQSRFSSTGPAMRKNFEGTVLWSIGQRTNSQGTAQFDVPMSDRITGWQVDVEAVSDDGAIGHATASLETFLPRFVDARLPAVLAAGDRYLAYAVMTNHGDTARLTVQVEASGGLALERPVNATVELAAGAAHRVALPLIARAAGDGRLQLTLVVDDQAVDVVERRVRIELPGAAVAKRIARRLTGTGEFNFNLPQDAQTPTATLRVFRSPSDVLLDGLDAMLRKPYGCFEQTSSTTYPNLLVLDLLRDRKGLAAVREKARRFVALGYQRLVSYEVNGGGFSWFGEAPANQVLTAYGLLEFADMAAVYPVDSQLLKRTRTWLIKKQKPEGFWAPDAQWLHDWKAAQDGAKATTAWIAWALAESGAHDPALDRAVAWLEGQIKTLNPFELGLLAGAQTRLKRAPTAMKALAAHTQDGRVHAGQSLFSRSATSADVQATALANQAWVRTGDAQAADAALDWIWRQRKASGWGNTQATVLALRAALAHRNAPPPAGSTVQLTLDGRAEPPLALDSVDVPMRRWPITPGAHRLTAQGPHTRLRADLDVHWRSPRPPQTPVALGLEITMERPEGTISLGHAAPFTVRLHNPGSEAVPMPTVEVPVPPGFRLEAEDFPPSNVARAEDQGDAIVFYLKRLAPEETRRIEFRLQALAEVDVLHRPATAYAYYDPELRGQSAAGRLVVHTPKPVTRLQAKPRLDAVQLGIGGAGRGQ